MQDPKDLAQAVQKVHCEGYSAEQTFPGCFFTRADFPAVHVDFKWHKASSAELPQVPKNAMTFTLI